MEIVYVCGRLIFSLASNVYQKKLSNQGLHPFFIVATTYCVLSLLAAPFLSVIELKHVTNTFWLNVSLASLFDVAGWMFLVLSLSKTDLSVFGPLNAYKVVVSMLLAVLFLNEIPSVQGLLGVLIIVVGSFFLIPPVRTHQVSRLGSLFADKGVRARFLSIVLFSVGTIFLKRSVGDGGALVTMVFWSLIGLPLILISNYFFLPNKIQQEIKATKPHLYSIVLIGLMVFFMQYLTLLLLEHMLVAYALALFQLGMVMQVLIGYQVFNEKDIFRKLLASIVMMLGSLLVLIA
ncbi:EamA family transporter [Methylotenera sp. L2L1]|uniref:EamA family transporter n=1 Tax=Methylotenera sp. L2L1 TaxID=1502770 RepID=UPI0005659356|nr:EamA family transporter [Methylotenera sp. L2L1]